MTIFQLGCDGLRDASLPCRNSPPHATRPRAPKALLSGPSSPGPPLWALLSGPFSGPSPRAATLPHSLRGSLGPRGPAAAETGLQPARCFDSRRGPGARLMTVCADSLEPSWTRGQARRHSTHPARLSHKSPGAGCTGRPRERRVGRGYALRGGRGRGGFALCDCRPRSFLGPYINGPQETLSNKLHSFLGPLRRCATAAPSRRLLGWRVSQAPPAVVGYDPGPPPRARARQAAVRDVING